MSRLPLALSADHSQDNDPKEPPKREEDTLTVRRMPLPVRVVPRHWWVPVRGGLTHNLTDLRSSF